VRVEPRQSPRRRTTMKELACPLAAAFLIAACSSHHSASHLPQGVHPSPTSTEPHTTSPRSSAKQAACPTQRARTPIAGTLELLAGTAIDRRVPGTVFIDDASGARCRTIAVGPTGSFSTQLPPGTYSITGRSPSLLHGPNPRGVCYGVPAGFDNRQRPAPHRVTVPYQPDSSQSPFSFGVRVLCEFD
jgi:hypothetical protein